MSNTTPPPIWKNVMRKKTEYSYGVLASAYQGEMPGKYFKISMPVPKDIVRMFGMDLSMSYDFSNGFFAKMFIRFVVSANDKNLSEATFNRVEILSNDPNVLSKIEVYFTSPCDIWIKSPGYYTECTVDRIHTMDTMRYRDITDTTIKLVDEDLPTTGRVKLRPKTMIFT